MMMIIIIIAIKKL